MSPGIEALARALHAVGAQRPVRALEALAVVLVRTGIGGIPASIGPVPDACRRIAARALAGLLPDHAAGATRWHVEGVLPAWAVGEPPVAELGGLLFYRL